MYSVYAKCTPWEYSTKEAQSCLPSESFLQEALTKSSHKKNDNTVFIKGDMLGTN